MEIWLLKMYTYVNRVICRVPQDNVAEVTTCLSAALMLCLGPLTAIWTVVRLQINDARGKKKRNSSHYYWLLSLFSHMNTSKTLF